MSCYGPVADFGSLLYSRKTFKTNVEIVAAAAAELPMTPESSAVRLIPDQVENTTNMPHQSHHSGRRRLAATNPRPLGPVPAFPTMPQPQTSNPMPVVLAAPINTVPTTLNSTLGLTTIPALSAPNSTIVSIGIPTGGQQKVVEGAKKEKREKSKNGQAKNPFQAKWYSTKKVYSDLTYYHKITIPGLAAFLKDEGIDVDSAFPKSAKYYLIQANGSLKGLNRGWAIVQKAKMVHQRVINFKKKGPSTLPDCREGENNDSLLVVTGSTALGKKGSDNKPAEEAFEGDSADGDFEWDDERVTFNPFTPSNGFGRTTDVHKSQTFGRKSKRPLESDTNSDGEDVIYVQSNHQRASRPAKMQKTGLISNGYPTQLENPDFAPWNTTTATLPPAQPDQQIRDEVSAAHIWIPDQTQAYLSGMDCTVILNMFNGLKQLQEKCMAEIGYMTLQGVQAGMRAIAAESAITPTDQQSTAPGYTVDPEGTVVDNAGKIVISIEVQKIVQMIVSAEAHYRNNEALRPGEDELLSREELGRLNIEDYDSARSALIKRLETDVDWTISHDLRRLEIIEAVEKIWPRLDPIIDNN